MAKKPAKLRLDVNELAFRTVRAALGEGERPHPPGTGPKNVEAAKRGKKGGKARATALSAKARSKAAKKAAKKRWDAVGAKQ